MEVITWTMLPLGPVVEFVDHGAAFLLAQTCSSSLVAVQAVHKGAVPPTALRCFFPPESALFSYACDSLMWEGESMQRNGGYWLECAANHGSVDEARALRAFGCAWDVRLCEMVAKQGHLELLKWMRAQRPPCPCNFNACLELAEDGGEVRAYFQTGLELLAMCNTEAEDDDTVTEMVADVVALIDQGVDINATDSDGWTPLLCACSQGLAEVAKALLQKGADVNAKKSDGRTPLHYACMMGLAEMAMALLDKGADLQAKTNNGWTLLHCACFKGLAEVAKALLEKGTDVSAKTSDGSTPLHWACMKGLAEVVKALLEKGADVQAKTNNGWTPLQCVCRKGQHDIAAMLRAKGAV
jgi:ankyrin repeat protein